MKRIAIVLTLFFFANCLAAQVTVTDSMKFSKELIAIEQALMDTIPSGDIKLWDSILDKNFFIVTEDGSRLQRNEFIKSLRPLPPGFSGWIKVTHPKCSFIENIAVINYVSDEHEFVFGQELHTSYSSMDTYLHKDGRWKMISSQVFETPQLPLPISVPKTILESYTGVFSLTDTVSCTISLQHDTLFIQKKGGTMQALLPETNNVFFRTSDTRGRKIFVNDSNGILNMLERRNGQDLVWKRISKTKM
jgi:Domain of unknown function (DUF4440)